MTFNPNLEIGLLGGGQLGRMLIQSALNFNLRIKCMDADPAAPCRDIVSDFVHGDITDYEQVLAFGQSCDVLTVEIENVNVEALAALAQQGKKVFPQPEALRIIKDKGMQKQFYVDHDIPTSAFVLTNSRDDLHRLEEMLPAVHKLRTSGYDGRGVQVIRTKEDWSKGFDAPSVLEKWVDYDKEISVVVARNESGAVVAFPVVELEYHPEANLVEFLFSPSSLPASMCEKAQEVAKKVIKSLNMVGLLAVEMFVTKSGAVVVNECAPRPHNSGHHTLEGNITSQFEQHLRAILHWPLGDTSVKENAVMINLLGEEGYSGRAKYEGIEEALRLPGAHIHLYGKANTRPFRKMGHATLVGQDLEALKNIARTLKTAIKITA